MRKPRLGFGTTDLELYADHWERAAAIGKTLAQLHAEKAALEDEWLMLNVE
jgi:hypothetical protein